MESETSNNSDKSIPNKVNFNVFNEQQNVDVVSNKEKYGNPKVINYPLQKQFADRALSLGEENTNLGKLNQNIHSHPYYYKSFQDLGNKELIRQPYDEIGNNESDSLQNEEVEIDNIEEVSNRHFNRNKQQASSLQRFNRD